METLAAARITTREFRRLEGLSLKSTSNKKSFETYDMRFGDQCKQVRVPYVLTKPVMISKFDKGFSIGREVSRSCRKWALYKSHGTGRLLTQSTIVVFWPSWYHPAF
jgi:hypothetical protein